MLKGALKPAPYSAISPCFPAAKLPAHRNTVRLRAYSSGIRLVRPLRPTQPPPNHTLPCLHGEAVEVDEEERHAHHDAREGGRRVRRAAPAPAVVAVDIAVDAQCRDLVVGGIAGEFGLDGKQVLALRLRLWEVRAGGGGGGGGGPLPVCSLKPRYVAASTTTPTLPPNPAHFQSAR